MLLSVEKWYEAISTRHSVRNYTGEPVSPDMMGQLSGVAQELSGASARVMVSRETVDVILQGAAGSYGKVLDAPAFAAVISDGREPDFQERCGYIGGAVVLEAVAGGLGTRWAAGSGESRRPVWSIWKLMRMFWR
ncbi:MAG: hypothetical protein IBX61_09700 [Thermoleophilia bacterium]|nr:hypothetical protein [Thermoleophilia bacterium]